MGKGEHFEKKDFPRYAIEKQESCMSDLFSLQEYVIPEECHPDPARVGE